jgi:hypothetical protein
MVATNPFDIPPWNQKVNEYIVFIFDFVEKFLDFDDFLLLFYLNDCKLLKEDRCYLKSYGFQFWMTWAMVNSLQLTNSEDPSLKVPSQSTCFN